MTRKEHIDTSMILAKAFDTITVELMHMHRNPKLFPTKQSFLVNSGEYVNVLCGQSSIGIVGSKTVYVNEAKGVLDSETVLRFPHENKLVKIDSGYLTILRSGLFAAYAIRRAGYVDKRIGLIGGGKINLMTAAFLSAMGVREIVLIGGRQRVDKNVQVFTKLTGLNVLTGVDCLRTCAVLISCTTNNEERDLILPEHAPNVGMVIAQDGGFTLSPKWRERFWRTYTDHPTQLANHWNEEFPYDTTGGGVLHPLHTLGRESYVGVYLYGTILADIIAAQWMLAGTIPDLFESDFYEALKELER